MQQQSSSSSRERVTISRAREEPPQKQRGLMCLIRCVRMCASDTHTLIGFPVAVIGGVVVVVVFVLVGAVSHWLVLLHNIDISSSTPACRVVNAVSRCYKCCFMCNMEMILCCPSCSKRRQRIIRPRALVIKWFPYKLSNYVCTRCIWDGVAHARKRAIARTAVS